MHNTQVLQIAGEVAFGILRPEPIPEIRHIRTMRRTELSNRFGVMRI